MRVEKRSKAPTLKQLKDEEKNLIKELEKFKTMNDMELKKNIKQALHLSNQLEEIQKQIKELENQEKEGDTKNMKVNKIVNQETNAEVRSLMAGTGEGSKFVETKLYKEIIKNIKENGGLLADLRLFESTGDLEVIGENATDKAQILEEGEVIDPKDATFNKVKFTTKRVGTAIEMTKKLLNSTDIDLVEYMANILGRRIENGIVADLCATGSNKFINIFGGKSIESESTSLTIADIQNLIFELKAQYKGNLYCNRNTLKQMAVLIDGNGVPFLKKVNGEYEILGTKVKVIEEAPNNKVLYMDPVQAVGLFINKNMEFNSVGQDSTQLLKGTVLSVADLYADVKVIDAEGMVVLDITA